MKPFIFAINVVLIFSAIDCRENPITSNSPNGSDTTSHNFSWTMQSFGGDYGACSLNDVVVINDTLAYAVGGIYLPDSTGQYDPEPHNFAVWNGITWTFQKARYYYQGGSTCSPANSIFAFAPDDIWIEGCIHWDGHQFNTVPLNIDFPSHVNKMWGRSSSDFYIVGDNGLLAHRDANGVWTKIPTGISFRIFDIWGAQNRSGEWEVLAIASNQDSTQTALLQIQSNNTVTFLNTDGLSPGTAGVWFEPEQRYYIVGGGIFQKSNLMETTWNGSQPGFPTIYGSWGVRGQGLNDIFVVGSFLEIVHFNGSTWQNYRNEIYSPNGALGGISFKENTVAMVGFQNAQAVAIIGRR